MTRNRELFRRVAEVIESFPEAHDQTVWGHGPAELVDITFDDGAVIRAECGTSHCVAGWACVLSGMRPKQVLGRPAWSSVLDDAGHPIPTMGAARTALGIDPLEASALFATAAFGDLPKSEVARRLRAIGDGADIRKAVES